MSYQFIHLEAYSRKSDKAGRSVAWVLDEADRKPDASLHVENPEPPKLVHGVSIAELRSMHDDAVAGARTTNKDGKEKAIRVDQKTLLTVVASHPYTVDECKADAGKQAEYERWERDTINWLSEQYGDGLKTVVRHSDESHMHIHAYILPSDLKALELHPGVSAKRREKAASLDRGDDAKTANKSGDQAYKESMRDWQNSYFDHVAVKHGLARLGPKLRRLSRAEWQREKVQAQSLKTALEKAAAIQKQGRVYVQKTKAEIAKIEDAAITKERQASAMVAQARDSARKSAELNENARKARAEAVKMLKKAKSDARVILKSADEKAQKTMSFGSRLKSFFDGFRRSRIEREARAKAKADAQKEIEEALEKARLAEKQAEQALNEMYAERRARYEVEKTAENLRASAYSLGKDVERLREQLPQNRNSHGRDHGLGR